jgi:hypothetical protein
MPPRSYSQPRRPATTGDQAAPAGGPGCRPVPGGGCCRGCAEAAPGEVPGAHVSRGDQPTTGDQVPPRWGATAGRRCHRGQVTPQARVLARAQRGWSRARCPAGAQLQPPPRARVISATVIGCATRCPRARALGRPGRRNGGAPRPSRLTPVATGRSGRVLAGRVLAQGGGRWLLQRARLRGGGPRGGGGPASRSAPGAEALPGHRSSPRRTAAPARDSSRSNRGLAAAVRVWCEPPRPGRPRNRREADTRHDHRRRSSCSHWSATTKASQDATVRRPVALLAGVPGGRGNLRLLRPFRRHSRCAPGAAAS